MASLLAGIKAISEHPPHYNRNLAKIPLGVALLLWKQSGDPQYVEAASKLLTILTDEFPTDGPLEKAGRSIFKAHNKRKL